MDFENLLRILHFYNDQLPIIATNVVKGNIEKTILSYLQNAALDTLYFTAPYISSYFVNVLQKTSIKSLFGIIDKDPPEYVKKAVTEFLMLAPSHGIDVNIVKRPPSSKFIHMKVMIPIYHYQNIGLIAPCAMVGSANLTMGGFRTNDEMVVVLRDRNTILGCLKTLYDKGIESKNITLKK